MEVIINQRLRLETEIPVLKVEKFHFYWVLGEHGCVDFEGYLNRNASWRYEQICEKQIQLCLIDSDKVQRIFCGYISQFKTEDIGQPTRFYLQIKSGSVLLDRESLSRSFQDIAKSYGEIVREAVQGQSGQVIRDREIDTEIGFPVICYDETPWQFAKRMADRLGSYVIPDIETGRPNLWFGMRQGKEVAPLSEESYTVELKPIGKRTGITYYSEGKSFYKIGDFMKYMGRKVTITGVEGHYEYGDLIFYYTLEERAFRNVSPQYCGQPSGSGFWGTIQSVKEDRVSIALDIDQKKSTGSYFYPWYPETGNIMYAMPEKGARALLHFFGEDQQEGAVIHCLNQNAQKRSYKDRGVKFKDGNYIGLTEESLTLSQGGDHTLSIDDDTVEVNTVKDLNILANDGIRIKARTLRIDTPEELIIYHG